MPPSPNNQKSFLHLCLVESVVQYYCDPTAKPGPASAAGGGLDLRLAGPVLLHLLQESMEGGLDLRLAGPVPLHLLQESMEGGLDSRLAGPVPLHLL